MGGEQRRRGPVMSHRGMASSSHPLVTLTGARLLAEGASAVDAALGMAAMAFVVLPGQCGLGGDLFAVIRLPGASTCIAVQGSGCGPDGADLGFFANKGLSSIPLEGALAVTVPGAPAAVAALHRLGSGMSLTDLWQPAIDAARCGVPVTPKTQEDIRHHAGALLADPPACSVFLPAKQVPRLGELLVQTDLASSLERVAGDPEDFYCGELADRCLATLTAGGAPFSGSEWRRGVSAPASPALQGSYQGMAVHQTGMPSPGYMLLQQAAMLDGFLCEPPPLSLDAVDLLARAARIAFADRSEGVGSDGIAWRNLLQPAATAAARVLLKDQRMMPTALAAPGGDTTSFVCVDDRGGAVSWVQSLAYTFGARLMVPGTGMLLNNRLARGSYLSSGHPNSLEPGRKPMHTLNAWITTGPDGELKAVGNTPGGDGQVQWNMQMLSLLFDHRWAPQDVVEAPRFAIAPGSDADALDVSPHLVCEDRLGSGVLDGLRERGHEVRVVGSWDGGGSAQLIVRDDGGCYSGGCDPRLEGCALGV